MLVNASKNTGNAIKNQNARTKVAIRKLGKKLVSEWNREALESKAHQLVNLREAGEVTDVYSDKSSCNKRLLYLIHYQWNSFNLEKHDLRTATQRSWSLEVRNSTNLRRHHETKKGNKEKWVNFA